MRRARGERGLVHSFPAMQRGPGGRQRFGIGRREPQVQRQQFNLASGVVQVGQGLAGDDRRLGLAEGRLALDGAQHSAPAIDRIGHGDQIGKGLRGEKAAPQAILHTDQDDVVAAALDRGRPETGELGHRMAAFVAIIRVKHDQMLCRDLGLMHVQRELCRQDEVVALSLVGVARVLQTGRDLFRLGGPGG